MHFALPPRKPSRPTIYPSRVSRLSIFRRRRIQVILLCLLGFGAITLLFSWRGPSVPSAIRLGGPSVVIVTVLNSVGHSEEYIEGVMQNRVEYAKKHGYATFFPLSTDYPLNNAPQSWAKIPAMRHAYTKFPETKYMWYLEQNALIMNPDLTVEQHIMNTKRMDSLMIREHPVVLPDSVIKTFGHLRGENIDFALTQDPDGLASSSFILRRGDWAKFFLDTWFDPLYRSYNFQKAETHALEHIVQWHPTILSRLALVPQRILNSYSRSTAEPALYQEGDFVVVFTGCELGGDRNCETESEPFAQQWRKVFAGR